MKPVEKSIACRIKSPRLRRNRGHFDLDNFAQPRACNIPRRFPMTLVVFQVGRLV
jgi:hypothetical protein